MTKYICHKIIPISIKFYHGLNCQSKHMSYAFSFMEQVTCITEIGKILSLILHEKFPTLMIIFANSPTFNANLKVIERYRQIEPNLWTEMGQIMDLLAN
ncbi:hypothetical protein EUGRSUZ_K00585 [Eucalyptus grandis]|uniref:Uncharacterized protein n=2 Tax=Eucalyptus grandis TaxID=71139 RepID=A0ACC3IQT9_EUCGR|nr:hypothetical protein EUGRSUZ_K00585 [Eucalyptus grandis]